MSDSIVPDAPVHPALQNLVQQLRAQTRGTAHDQLWRDDQRDPAMLECAPVLPSPGRFGDDLFILANADSEQDEAPSRVLLKANPRCTLGEDGQLLLEGKAAPHTEYTVWMTDTLSERYEMFEAAKRAQGKVLCGGMGLGLFQQFALKLGRTTSITVVEREAQVAELLNQTWAEQEWEGRARCTTVVQPIEQYLAETQEKYDTVYIDTWDALHYEYLPHVNCLIERGKRVLRPKGEILLWGWSILLEQYLALAAGLFDDRARFLEMPADGVCQVEEQYPLFAKLLRWYQGNWEATMEQLVVQAYHFGVTAGDETSSLELGVHFLSDHSWNGRCEASVGLGSND